MKDKIKQSIKWILIGRQAQFAIALLFQFLIMRILSPEVFGIYALAESSLGFIALFVSFGFPQCIIQFQKTENIEKNVLGITVLQGLAYAALTLPGVFVVRGIYGGQIARIYLLLIAAHILTFFTMVFQFVIERDLEFKKAEIVISVSRLAGVLTIFGIALAGGGVYSLVAGFYARVLLETAIFFKCSRWKYGIGWDRKVLMVVISYGSKRFLAQACGTMRKSLDKLLLGLMVPVAFVGAYERGQVIISTAVGLVSQVDARFAFSLINRIKDDARRLNSLINKGIFLNVVLAAAFALAALFFLQDLVILILGEQWEETARLLPYFSIYLVVIVPAVFIQQVFFATKNPLCIVWGRLLSIATFVLITLGIGRLGASGEYSVIISLMAINLGFSSLIEVGYLVAILLRLKQLQPVSFMKPLLLAGLSGLGGWCLLLFIDLPSLAVLIIVGLVYGGLLWKFCRPDLLWLKQYWQS